MLTARKPLVVGSDGNPQQLQAGDALSGAIVLSAGTQLAQSGTAVLSNANGVSFGLSNSSVVTASYAFNLSAGTTSNNLQAVTLANGNGVSFGLNGSTVTASYAFNLSAGTTSNNLNVVTFADGNGVSFGLNASTVTASIAAGATATGNLGAIAAGTQTATSGSVVLSNSNNLTFGMSGSTRITASYNFNLSGGSTSNNLNAVTFADGNGVSFGLNASTMTASVAAGATATGNFGALAAGTQTATSGTVVFTNSNNITFGLSGSTRVSASYNFNVSAGTTSGNVNAVTFADGGGISFGYNNGTITATVSPAAAAGIGAIAAGTQTATSGTVVFANSNNLTFGMSGSSQITGSYAFNVSAGGASSNLTQLLFGNKNNFSFGYNNASEITGSFAPPTWQVAGSTTEAQTVYFSDVNNISWAMQTLGGSVIIQGNPGFKGIAAGTQTANTATAIFQNSNGITFGMSGSSLVTASYAFNLSAGTTSNNLRSVTFSNSNGVSFGLNASTMTASYAFNASAGTTSNNLTNLVFADSNAVSFGLNGSTITASIPNLTLSSYEPYPQVIGTNNTVLQSLATLNSLSSPPLFYPFQLPDHAAVELVNMVMQMSLTSQTAATQSCSQSGTFAWGIYTRTGSSISLLTSSFFSYQCLNPGTGTVSYIWPYTTGGGGTYSASTVTAASLSSLYTGLKNLQLGINATLTPGQYWLGVHHRNSFSVNNGGSTGFSFSLLGGANVLTNIAPVGVASSGFSSSSYRGSDGLGPWRAAFAGASNAGNVPNSLAFSSARATVTIIPYMALISRV